MSTEPISIMYADVLLPLAVPKPYTYIIPNDMLEQAKFGVRAEVSFGRGKLYSGIIVKVHNQTPGFSNIKSLLNVLDDKPIITPQLWEFWQWIATYYCCHPGEVMSGSLPANLKLGSETKFHILDDINLIPDQLNNEEWVIAEALQVRRILTIEDCKIILQKERIMPVVKSLIEKGIMAVSEEIQNKYKPRTVNMLRFLEPYRSDPETIKRAFELTLKSEIQTNALLKILQQKNNKDWLQVSSLTDEKINTATFKSLEKKGILEIISREISRINEHHLEDSDLVELDQAQIAAIEQIQSVWQEKTVCLLKGVTGSGKTMVYIELAKAAIQQGKQVLILLPEIALTNQITQRLKQYFVKELYVYHSRLNNNERVELWQKVQEGKGIILGARSALMLPFSNLGLIIVDEEHDSSYKQSELNPRFHARDSAIYYAGHFGAKVLLGSATPSVESYYNAKKGKYGLVRLTERYGGSSLPVYQIVPISGQAVQGKVSIFSEPLINSIIAAKAENKQVILFQNRRGYAPVVSCNTCQWTMDCPNCDVKLTYHKSKKIMQCHYCGYQTDVPARCPACNSNAIQIRGTGTERIAEDLQLTLPDLRIARVDLDTTRTKDAAMRIFESFAVGELDVLVGTQMVTKGLDFDHVSTVGILNLDALFWFPDYRAQERAYQLVTQVAGRAGRRQDRGKIIIQTTNPSHPLIDLLIKADYEMFYQREIMERNQFHYPPFSKLIHLQIWHKDPKKLDQAVAFVASELFKHLGDSVKGPVDPPVNRIRNQYIKEFLIKLNNQSGLLKSSKLLLLDLEIEVRKIPGCSGVKYVIDVG